jgi:glutamate/tyrosine decarboxylase-like PLP-dependent enzyme
MGNRIGIHNALAQYPGPFVYFSSASHYSVKKTVSDCDDLCSRWQLGRVPRFAEIPAEYGCIVTQALVRQVLSDRAECFSYHEIYRVIIFANLGTTFAGGQDNRNEIGDCKSIRHIFTSTGRWISAFSWKEFASGRQVQQAPVKASQ